MSNTELIWVSCARDLSWEMAESKHLIQKGGITTLCGATGSIPNVWRRNSKKPACVTCSARDKRPHTLTPSTV